MNLRAVNNIIVMPRQFLVYLYLLISTQLFSQEFSMDEAIRNYESLAATNQDLPAAKTGLKIADHYFREKAYKKAVDFYEKSLRHASKTADIPLQARMVYKKGVAQKLLAESGRLAMADEQQYFKESVSSFKRADDLFIRANKRGSRDHLNSMLLGGEALYIIGNYKEAVNPLRTVLRYAQKNKYEDLILRSSDLLAKNYKQLDEELNHAYYASVYDSYNELKVSKDSLKRAQHQLKLSKDSLSRSHQKLMTSIDSLARTQRSLEATSQSLTKSKDSLRRSRESLMRYEASLKKAQDSLAVSKDSLEKSIVEIALLDSANLQQRTTLEIRQAEIIQKQREIIKQQEEIHKKEEEVNIRKAEVTELNNSLQKISFDLSEKKEILNYMIIAIALVGILLFSALLAYQYKRRTNKKLEENNRQINDQKSLLEKRQQELKEEKSRTEALLLNILPEPVADELRRKKKVIPRYYKMVTIMFTDFKGFTSIAAKMSPGEIVRELDACFVAFDQIIERYEKTVNRKCIEKIKTIGDGYMCAGGVPIENESNPLDIVRVALAMIEYMEKRKKEKMTRNEPYFEIRIGINTGPVVAGVVGKKKFAYDIWGDAVNLASRMESTSEVGRVNISGETYRYIRDKFFFTHRGKINAKNKGEVDMYFVDGRVRYKKMEQPSV
ncbi:MAG: hypothetical protein MI975_28495 [Cytophagales bacterium]|nr:hypothetical protein [Cytophagales bacterium]